MTQPAPTDAELLAAVQRGIERGEYFVIDVDALNAMTDDQRALIGSACPTCGEPVGFDLTCSPYCPETDGDHR